MDEPEYETVWNGGAGLTTVGAQRPGAVQQCVGGCVIDWIDVAEWQRTHPARAATGRYPYRHVGGVSGGAVATEIAAYDVADISDRLYRWLETYDAKRWSRLVRFASWVSWPFCELCGATQDPRKAFAPGLGTRAHRTPYHRGVCQSCYVRYRMARGRWKGAALIASWARLHPKPAPSPEVLAARAARRREVGRLAMRRQALRRKAARSA